MASIAPHPALIFLLVLAVSSALAKGNFYQDVDITWGDGRAKILDNGQLLTLSLDKSSGSGFQSKSQFLFGQFDMQIKLVPGILRGPSPPSTCRRKGRCTTRSISSSSATSAEIRIFCTPIFTLKERGTGSSNSTCGLILPRTSTPTLPYGILHILFSFLLELVGRGGLGDEGGLVKTDWSQAPFTAAFRGLSTDGCTSGVAACSNANNPYMWQQDLDSANQQKLKWVQKNYMVYNYCTDVKRFPQGLPPECSAN
uniref:Xyloglucan endotransglucosylase/hydrolase n=1 Tax=Ananas comosus var. bracteatus TaxID=296719 RepID=A0A6V7PA32_ANACO|nr:unnamed protein product [Ananas comosus var. bracteatus]